MTPFKVAKLGARDVCHPWTGPAYVTVPRAMKGCWSHQEHVDPYPAYSHDVELVHREARRVIRALPIGVPVLISVLAVEGLDRVNGHCRIDYDYKGEKPHPWAASIVLWGKRIPIHPAMTRYLVAHEYGHAVEKYIATLRGETGDSQKLRAEYGRLRGCRRQKYYGGGTWHASPGELFANDFRILVAGAEPEFWPHPGFQRPERVAAVRAFWKEHAR